MADKKKKGKLLGEFKTFALRGSVIDLAVGVIIGGAFSKITGSLVNDVLMPFIGMFLGGVDFAALSIKLPVLFPGNEPGSINVGVFINTVIEFIILAFVVFLIVKGINALRAAEEKRKKTREAAEAAANPPAPPAPAEPTREEQLLTEIRDLLKKK